MTEARPETVPDGEISASDASPPPAAGPSNGDTPVVDGVGTASSDPSAPESNPDALRVRLPIFEGPLDLLLHLIRKQQIDIRDIPIVTITEQYIEYLNLMKELNLDLAGEYLVMAATLIHIKSKMLLPQEPATESGEEPEDPRAELVQKLLEYERFKHASDVLYERDRVSAASYPRGAGVEFEAQSETLLEASLFDLVTAFKLLLEERKRVRPFTVEAYRVSVAERVAELVAWVDEQPEIAFRQLFRPEATKDEWIVTFLALLELARLQAIRIMQKSARGEIVIIRREGSAGLLRPVMGSTTDPAPSDDPDVTATVDGAESTSAAVAEEEE